MCGGDSLGKTGGKAGRVWLKYICMYVWKGHNVNHFLKMAS
jgi:hypothetical protein